MRHRAKFHADRSNCCRGIADFQAAILDLFYSCLDHPRRVFDGLCDCKIWLESVQ